MERQSWLRLHYAKWRRLEDIPSHFVLFQARSQETTVTPHLAQSIYECDTKTGKRVKRESCIDARTTNILVIR